MRGRKRRPEVWHDGTCMACGSDVIEMPDTGDKDYMNMCTNRNCEHFYWHQCDDCEMLNYYTHSREEIS
jgi:hypothetical protein